MFDRDTERVKEKSDAGVIANRINAVEKGAKPCSYNISALLFLPAITIFLAIYFLFLG